MFLLMCHSLSECTYDDVVTLLMGVFRLVIFHLMMMMIMHEENENNDGDDDERLCVAFLRRRYINV